MVTNIEKALKRAAEDAFELKMKGAISKIQKMVQTGHTPASKTNTSAKKRTVKRYGAVYSKSAGFIKRGRKMRNFRKWKKFMDDGVVTVNEKGGIVTSQYCRYIGHASMPRDAIIRMVWAAVVKKLLVRVGYPIEAAQIVIGGMPVGDVIVLSYKESPAAPIGSVTFTVAGPTSLLNIADYFRANVLDNNNYEFIGINYNPSATSPWARILMPLQNFYLKFDCKGSLKIQNRSTNSADDEQSDEVDNVPLYGRSYEGTGSGTLVDTPAMTPPANLFADDQTGVILYDGVNDMREPMLPPSAVRAKRSGKVRLEPGHIKTSSLQTKMTIRFNDFFTKLGKFANVVSPSTTAYSQHPLGKFKLMALEKIIETQADPLPITVAYEHNLRIAVSCFGKPNQTRQTFVTFNA